MYLLGLALMLLNLYLAHRVRAYTSDDVSLQNALLAWRPFGHGGNYHTGADPFILKIPVYWLLGLVFEPSRQLLFWTSALFAAASFTMFYVAILYFLGKFRVKFTTLNLLPFVWLAGLGLAFGQLFLNPNLRNFELGAMFLFYAYIAKLYYNEYRPLSSNWAILRHVLLWVVIGLFLFNDLYFFYLGLVPVGILAVYWLLKQPKHRRTALIVIVGSAISFATFVTIRLTAAHSGFSFINSAPPTIIPYDQLYSNIAATIHSLFLIFDADVWGRSATNPATIVFVVNAVVLGACLYAIKRFRHEEEPEHSGQWFAFFASLCGFAVAYYTLGQLSEGIATYRYLVIIPMASVLFLAIFMRRSSTLQRIFLAALLIASAAFNTSYAAIQAVRDKSNPNGRNILLYQTLQKQGYTHGYAPYWDAVIATYLSNHQVNTVPVTCRSGSLQKFPWLVTDGDMQRTASKTFLVLDPEFEKTGELCPEAVLQNQFGQHKRSEIIAGWRVLFYDKDVLK